MNTKAQQSISTGFGWIYGLVTLFGLGVIYIVFNQVFSVHLVPTMTTMVNTSTTIDAATKATVLAGYDKYMSFFHIMPFVLFFVVVIWMVVLAVRKERENY